MDSMKCEAFLTAVERGSLTAAGNQLGYTQSGITRMIRALEREAGFTLLVRTKHGVQPTANGRQMMAVFRDIVQAQRHAAEMGADIRGMLSGVLTIGSYYSVSAFWLPKILKTFQQQFPKVKIHLREGTNQQLSAWLNEKSVDCCLSAEPTRGTICDWLPICEDDLMVWLPPDHPLAGAATFPIDALDGAPFIITLPGHDTDIDRFLEQEQINPDIRFTTADPYTTYCMVEEGLGVSLNNRLTTQNWQGKVVTIPFAPARHISLGLAVPKLKEASPAARRFVDCVMSSVLSRSDLG